MEKNYGSTVITLGIIACILFFIAGIKLGVSGSELVGIRSVSGTSIAEAYYQEIGRFGQAYSLMSFAFGLMSLGLSLGIGNYLKLKERSIKSFQGLGNNQVIGNLQGQSEIVNRPDKAEKVDLNEIALQGENTTAIESDLKKSKPKGIDLKSYGFFAILIGLIMCFIGVSELKKKVNTPFEERIEQHVKIYNNVNAKLRESGLEHLTRSSSEIRALAFEEEMKEIRNKRITLGLGLVFILLGAILVLSGLKKDKKNKEAIKQKDDLANIVE